MHDYNYVYAVQAAGCISCSGWFFVIGSFPPAIEQDALAFFYQFSFINIQNKKINIT
jgi:hypothetical protein